MPDSIAHRDEALAFLERQFGIAREALADLTLIDRGDEIWACRSAPPAGLVPARPGGLRALRRQADGLKPTSTFLTVLGDRITASRLDLDPAALRQALLGRRIPVLPGQADGYFALCFRGDVVGCAKVRSGSAQALLPTGRRRELLAALAVDPRS